MTKIIKMMAMMFCVITLATLSSCSKDPELTGIKWKCTYNKEYYGHFTKNQYVGTEWEFSNKVADDDLDYYYLYINGVQVGSYSFNKYANFYEIEQRSIESTAYNEIVEYLNGWAIRINGNAMAVKNYAEEPIIEWVKQ